MYINRLYANNLGVFVIGGLINAIILIYLNPSPTFAQTSVSDYCHIYSDSSLSICIYGKVYYRNLPVPHARVQITVNGERDETYTELGENKTTYAIPSTAIGEVIHITAEFAGETAHRRIRIRPDETGNQEVNLVIPPTAIWNLWNIRNNIYKLQATQDNRAMIAASKSGILWVSRDIIPNAVRASNARVNHVAAALPLNYEESEPRKNEPRKNEPEKDVPHMFHDGAVYDIALDSEGIIWAITEEGLFSQSEKDSGDWIHHDLLIGTPLHTLLIDQENEVVWVGGGSNEQGELVMYEDGEWSQVYTTQAAIHALVLDHQHNLWVGTWGAGVYQYNNQEEWTQHTTTDGLASDYIHTILAGSQPTGAEIIWFGTAPTTEQRESRVQGGISTYNLTEQMWQTYTTDHGLPAHDEITDAVANIYTFAITHDNIVWAGTDHGLYMLGNNVPGYERWIRHDPEIDGRVSALTLFNGQLFAATSKGLKALQTTYRTTHSVYGVLTADINGNLLKLTVEPPHDVRPVTNVDVTWSWTSTSYGPLCTSLDVCTYPLDALPPGTHRITLHTQNPIGHQTESHTLDVVIPYKTYLPTIQR